MEKLNEMNYEELKEIFYDENSQTPKTQRFNKLLKEKDIDFEVCLSRKDDHLYMYTEFLKIPLFKSKHTCKDDDWVSIQIKLLPVYKVLDTFSSSIANGVLNDVTTELEFDYDDKYTVELKLVDSDKLEVKVTYYNRKVTRGSYSFDVGDGKLSVYSKGFGGENSFCYSVSEPMYVSEFDKSTLTWLTGVVERNLNKMGYTI